MFIDSSLIFSNNQSLAVSASTASTNVVDLAGVGSGNAPNASFGTATSFGTDPGPGRELIIPVTTGTAFATATGATLQVAVQGAPDNGSNAPGTYATLVESGVIAAANLTADTKIAELAVPKALPDGTKVRFLQILYVLPASTSFTAGTIAFAGIVLDTDDNTGRFISSGYSVA